jgi:simple sugar transport system permease protein
MKALDLLWRGRLLWGLALLLLAGIATSPIDSDGNSIFLASSNLLNVLRQVSITGILAVGMTLVILTGGIDLAVGSLMAFGATLCAMLLTLNETHNGLWIASLASALCAAALLVSVLPQQRWHSLLTIVLAVPLSWGFWQLLADAPSILLIIVATVAAGTVLGAVSGNLVARGGLQPFIATLAMMVAALGLARLMAGQDRSVFPIYSGMNAPESFDVLRGTLLGIPVPGLVFVVVVILVAVLLGRFRFGRYIYAIGGNERAAFLAGVPVAKVKVAVYSISGALAALAGVLYAAQYRQGKPDAGTGMELDAIAAVVIGGANLMGGKGTVWGTLAGVLIFGFLSNILQLNNVDSNTQLVLKGIIIVLAVLLQEGNIPNLFKRASK